MSEIFEVSDRAVDRVAAADPVLATYAGVAGFDHAWPDLSPSGHAQRAELYGELRAEASRCVVETERELLAQSVLVSYCDEQIRFVESGGHRVDLNSIASPHQALRMIYGSMPSETVGDWNDIISRLQTTGEALEGYRATLDEGRRREEVVSRRQVEKVLEQGRAFAGQASTLNELRDRLAESTAYDEVLAGQLDDAMISARSAFAEFNTYLEDEYLPESAATDAVGQQRYVLSAERFLGTEIDPVATYRWGWNEIERLWGEMQTACAQIDPAVPASEVLHELTTSPDYAAADVDDFVQRMTERQHQALANLEGVHFDVPEPIRRIDVKVQQPGGALAAFYVGPSEDYSRAGAVWYPIEGKSHLPLFTEVTIAYHEGFPGHHLQIGVQSQLRDELSRFHRSIVWYPGSGEGWALYAEHIMGELGYLERPEYRIGLLNSQLLRAARVAIDIGVHLELPIPDDVSFHPGEQWSFALAKELLTTRAFIDADFAESEVIRYFGWPGQAISYKVGEKAILDLRDEWDAASDSAFDAKAFHSAVLSVGSVGLDLLREQVRAAMPTS